MQTIVKLLQRNYYAHLNEINLKEFAWKYRKKPLQRHYQAPQSKIIAKNYYVHSIKIIVNELTRTLQ